MNQRPPETDDHAIEQILRRAGDMADEKQLRTIRAHVLTQLFVMFKSLLIRELDNDVFIRPSHQLREGISAFIRINREEVIIRMIREEFYMNRELVRLGDRGWETLVFLKQAFKRMGISELTIMEVPDDESLRTWLAEIQPVIRKVVPAISGQLESGPFLMRASDAVRDTEAEIIAQARDRMLQSFSLLTVHTEDMLERVRTQRAPNMREIRRTLQDLVSDSEKLDWLLLGIIEVDAHRSDLAGHLARTAVYTMLLGRAAGLTRLDILNATLAGICHDLGRLDLEESGVTLGDATDWLEQDPKAPLLTVRRLLQTRGVDVSVAIRSVATFEYQVEADPQQAVGFPAWRAGQYCEPRTPSLAARLIAIADAYDTLRFRGVSRPALLPDARVRVLLAGRDTRYDGVLVNAFYELLGDNPPGSLVRLSDGRHAVVTRPARPPTSSDRPTVAILVDSKGEPTKEVELVDLARQDTLSLQGQVDPKSLNINVARAFAV